MNKFHVNKIMLHVTMIYFACRDRSMPPEDKFEKKNLKIHESLRKQNSTQLKKIDALGKTSS